jgi:hypothetical protein
MPTDEPYFIIRLSQARKLYSDAVKMGFAEERERGTVSMAAVPKMQELAEDIVRFVENYKGL